MYEKLFLDQCGYRPDMKKRLTLRTQKPHTPFRILRSDGSVAWQGVAGVPRFHASAHEWNCIGDFSDLTQPGRYYAAADGLGESDGFEISPSVYDELFQACMRFFWLQRCGDALPEDAAGRYAHPHCHTGLAVEYGGTLKRDVTGGWHDAGDYGRYVVPGAMAVAQLLLAFEENPALCASFHNPRSQTPEAGADMPDFLAEVAWELRWLLKMQREDGAVFHKVTCRRFCGFIMPHEEKEELVLSPVSPAATWDFAAVCAMAARVYRTWDPAFAETLGAAAKRAYAAAPSIILPGGFKNPPDILTGEYEDACTEDEHCWAAAELYRTFGDSVYRCDFERLAGRRIFIGYGWRDMGAYGNLAYLATSFETSPALRDKIRAAMLAEAETRLAIAEADGFGVPLSREEYSWGSNMDAANFAILLMDAARFTQNARYCEAAADTLHYLLGRNPMGLCYVTGFGTHPIRHPHHRPSGFQGAAMPGMLSGGPCSWLADELVQSVFTKQTPPAKALLDMTGSYSTNEVTIYWNSALLLLLARLLAPQPK